MNCDNDILQNRSFAQMTFISGTKKKQKDNFKAFLTEGASYTEIEQYPIIEEWMIPEKIDDVFDAVPLDRLSEIKNIKEWYVCPYCCDEDLLKIYRNPWKYVNTLRRAKAVLGFDLSPHSDMPYLKQKNQMYDNLAITYYMGKRHVKIIPNVRYGCRHVADDYLKAFPHHRLISIGTYGCVKTVQEKRIYYDFLCRTLPELEPSGITVYGSMPKDVFSDFVEDYRFYHMMEYIKRIPFENSNQRGKTGEK